MGLMGFGGKWIFRLLFPLALIAGILFYFGQGLQDASLEKFDVTGIKDITTKSFTITGTIFVKNPSDLSIPIESITYDVFLKDTQEKIGTGTLPSFTLEKSKTSAILFNQEIQWIPTLNLATSLVTKEKVIIEITGEIRINIPKIKEYALPFTQETDIKAYIAQFVPMKEKLPLETLPSLPIEDSLPLPSDENLPLPSKNQPNDDNPSDTLVPDLTSDLLP